MKIINAAQGSDEWLAIRAKHFTASEAPAMMGASKYMTRNELLKQKATGIVPEASEAKQRVFDEGHQAEADARPHAEALIGDELYPVTAMAEIDGLPLLASFDGLTMDESIAWENKLWNVELANSIHGREIPPHYYWQLEQQLLVSGAEKVLFMTSDGTENNTVCFWYISVPERRAALIAGWKQFSSDLADYQHVYAAPETVATPQTYLPSVSVQVRGEIAIIDNLGAFGDALTAYIDRINKLPQTDQDFADLEATVKSLKAAEDALESAERGALAQTASIDTMRRTVGQYRDMARSNRLIVEKLVKAEKENRKVAIIQGGKDALSAHCAELTRRIGKPYLPMITGNFAESIKGMKNLSSMKNAVDTELARRKIEANAIADKIEINLNLLRETAKDHVFLFADTAQIVLKENDDFTALVKMRMDGHSEAEAKRLAAERERIQLEEQAKAEAKVRAEAEAKQRADAEAKRMREEQEKHDARIASESATQKLADVSESSEYAEAVRFSLAPKMPLPAPPIKTPSEIVVDGGKVVRAFLDQRIDGKNRNLARAIIMEFLKFQAEWKE